MKVNRSRRRKRTAWPCKGHCLQWDAIGYRAVEYTREDHMKDDGQCSESKSPQVCGSTGALVYAAGSATRTRHKAGASLRNHTHADGTSARHMQLGEAGHGSDRVEVITLQASLREVRYNSFTEIFSTAYWRYGGTVRQVKPRLKP